MEERASVRGRRSITDHHISYVEGHIWSALPSLSAGSSEAAPKEGRDEKGPLGVGGARRGSHGLASAAGERARPTVVAAELREAGPGAD